MYFCRRQARTKTAWAARADEGAKTSEVSVVIYTELVAHITQNTLARLYRVARWNAIKYPLRRHSAIHFAQSAVGSGGETRPADRRCVVGHGGGGG